MCGENDFFSYRAAAVAHGVKQYHAARTHLSWYLFMALSPVFAQLISTHLCRGGTAHSFPSDLGVNFL